jgi:hypothetical protein
MRALIVAALSAACALAPSSASAEPEKRAVPNYDGRDKKTTASDVLLWPPRIVVFPFYLTSEYVLRRPIGYVATTAEKNRWPAKVIDFFTFDKEHKSGFVPTFFYDFGFRPSVGLYFFWNDLGFKGHDVRAHVGNWGPGWISVGVAERFYFRGDRAMFSLKGEYIHRPDGLFAGIGPRSLEQNLSRFGFRRIAAAPGFDINIGGLSTFSVQLGVRKMSFHDDQNCCGDPPMRDLVARGVYERPPGFDGFTAIYQRASLALDSRRPTGSTTGIRAQFDFEHAGDVGTSRARQWVRYGAQLGGFLALDSRGRTLGFILHSQFADPVAGGEVPFTEQASLPYASSVGAGIVGIGALRGFRPGRLVDRSSLVATLQYTWPIWIWLDGAIHVAAGNVYGVRLREFEPNLTRFSTGIGFRSVGTPDHQFEFMVAVGTETIADGLGLNTIRILAGATRGF